MPRCDPGADSCRNSATIAERGRHWFEASPDGAIRDEEVEAFCHDLLSSLGEATGVALAHHLLLGFEARDADGKTAFFTMLNARFSLDPELVFAAAQTYRGDLSPRMLKALKASEPPRQELLRRLNLAPQGTRRLGSGLTTR